MHGGGGISDYRRAAGDKDETKQEKEEEKDGKEVIDNYGADSRYL